ncbi:hypothetical protein TDB9533_01107 [Thalassocella blandensis]|nr:hypothetical protein TDB9533_01107 [Thalassocella blandensis]
MKIRYISLLLFFNCTYVYSEAFSPEEIESQASHYRMLAIECITDKKIMKKETLAIESCRAFKGFIKSKYPILKTSLESAQRQVKVVANTEGLESKNVRETLVLLMSARSHMQIAGEISTKI